MIEVKNLTKRYGNTYAIHNISFTVKDGEVVGFLGPNGAGKSTTMNILTGYLSATEGKAIIGGFDILEQPNQAKQRMGYLPEVPPLYLDMAVEEYLNFLYELKRVDLARGPHIKEICDLVKISHVYKRLIKNLSKGYRQRVGIAQAMLGNPEVLILDEPTVGLDPSQIIEIRRLIKKLGEKHTVILSSHMLQEVQAICDRVIVMNNGRLVADGTTEELSKLLLDNRKVILRVDGPKAEIHKLLQGIPNVEAVNYIGMKDGIPEFSVEAKEGTDVRKQIFLRLAERQWPILIMKPTEMTLEDIFMSLTGDGKKRRVKS
ncbi:MAG: ABC transporter ATP-binding protein [Oscillospiraceae bacterium]|jgi:ABC-2 type transport system ATP-binding protein|nr:ABC transporter ATP-binding protein [Oscillospiraceae bacterium]